MNNRAAFFLLLAAALTGCRRDMFDQARTIPLRSSDFYPDHASSRPVPPHTISQEAFDQDEAFATGMIGTNLVTDFPFPVTRETLKRGRERFNIYCAVCHGASGEGNGMIVQRGFPPPPSYHIDRLRNAPAGHFYHVITEGYGAMYSYAARVASADRWAIVAYIRALQLSHSASLADVPPAERISLEAQP